MQNIFNFFLLYAQWRTWNYNVTINGANATLQRLGYELLTANLGDFSKNIGINIKEKNGQSGTDDILAENALLIYPNPVVNGELIIKNAEMSSSDIQISDLTGKVIFACQLSTANSIDVSALPQGLYLVKADKKTGKFIKK